MQIQTANYDLVTTWRGGMASRTLCQSFTGEESLQVLQSHVIDSDEPVSLGSEGLAPNPQELILAAFNACMRAALMPVEQLRKLPRLRPSVGGMNSILATAPDSDEVSALMLALTPQDKTILLGTGPTTM